ncbi:beta-glucanase (GH16 family) [Flavobacterium sp. 7E]|uniref:T9SS type A sorting domain-containing protein n=1 Tax=Flavobacterium sp. 7E TaxID=2735898 RepID=UPI001570A4AE|nr:family 16 glycosylhydrolase [Flavobacterium sp. 7E]NRS90418.1 beta-glucanase (GH16 family) [Flavobacterium sp. 7E]
MKKVTLLALLHFCVVSKINAQFSPFLVTPNPTKNWDFQANMSDEFNNSNINWTNKWYLNNELPTIKAWKWDNNKNIKIVNNSAEIKVAQNDNNIPVDGTYFSSGILKSQGTFTTGYIEARIKGAVIDIPGMDNGRGVCPSFWLYSNFYRNASEGQTVYSEIDVVELQQFDYYDGEQDDVYDMDHNLHLVRKINGKDVWTRPKQSPQTQKNHSTASFDPSKGYHIYGCEVNTTEIIWYVDGKEVARKPNTYWNRPMNVTLSLGLRVPFVKFIDNVFEAANPAVDSRAKSQLPAIPVSMSVDYVRVWTGKMRVPTLETPTFETTKGINVYPNPATDVITIKLNEFKGKTKIYLSNLSGVNFLTLDTDTVETTVPIDNIPSGIYFLTIKNSTENRVQKIIIK